MSIADDRRLPFEIKSPNADTQRAIEEFETEKSQSFDSVEALMDYLNADD